MARQESVGSSVGISIQNNVVPTIRRPRILLAASGNVPPAHAIYFQALTRSVFYWTDIAMLVSNSFLQLIDVQEVPTSIYFYVDDTQWLLRNKPGEYNLLHIALRDWADIMVIAPLTADTLGKIALGFSDNLLTSIVGAWDFSDKPLIIAPYMNNFKWCNPLTQEHVEMIERRGVRLIPPTIADASGNCSADAMAGRPSISGVLLDCLVSTGWTILRAAL